MILFNIKTKLSKSKLRLTLINNSLKNFYLRGSGCKFGHSKKKYEKRYYLRYGGFDYKHERRC